MTIGFFLTWALHQAFGTQKGDLIVSLLSGPLGNLINTASHDKAQSIVTEINSIAQTGLSTLTQAGGLPGAGAQAAPQAASVFPVSPTTGS